ncbi:MAG: 16S rRNA (guanine(527)-N(7))-methyltransferase RsmG [Porticoccaceae bacterium]|nr:16S rRNA (guanine(527)-N(7))-methyltransferase RsmG [Porticoccaceae bacterium]
MSRNLKSEPALRAQLEKGIEDLGIECSADQVELLLDYVGLLVTWNNAYNLTAIRQPERMIALHILDSLAILPYVTGDHLIDVGTGPGLPGIPLAIMCPEKTFKLLDSNGKKTRFLFHARCQLKLQNLTEVQSRVEQFIPEQTYDTVLSRAFTSVAEMVDKCKHLLNEEGRFLAMKGKFPQSELSLLEKDYKVDVSHRLVVPDVEGERHLIEISKAKITE